MTLIDKVQAEISSATEKILAEMPNPSIVQKYAVRRAVIDELLAALTEERLSTDVNLQNAIAAGFATIKDTVRQKIFNKEVVTHDKSESKPAGK